MSPRRILAALVAALVLAGIIWLASDAKPPSTLADTPTRAGGVVLPPRSDSRSFANARSGAAAAPDPVAVPPLPASLVDTVPDGALLADAAGRLVITAETRAYFDYFLTAIGEISLVQMRALIVAAIEERLAPDAAREAIALLDRYLDYRRRSRALVETGAVPEDLRARLDLLRALRRETLGEDTAETWFGTEERMLATDLRRREILQDRTLAPRERDRLLAEAEQALPAEVRQARDAVRGPLRLLEDEAALRDAGGTTEEVQALRQREVGPDAARRLEELDRERAAWQLRLEVYRTERASIDAAVGLSPGQRRERVAALREQHFSATERLRVEAIEQVDE